MTSAAMTEPLQTHCKPVNYKAISTVLNRSKLGTKRDMYRLKKVGRTQDVGDRSTFLTTVVIISQWW
jgi:hypothetical protein